MEAIRFVRLAAVGVALAVAVPLAAQSAAKLGPGHHGNRALAGLNLTAAQKAQIKTIHGKYKAQFAPSSTAKADMQAAKAARTRGDTAAARAAFAKARSEMKANRPAREQEMAEIRTVLTPAQQQTLDQRIAELKQQGGHRGRGAPSGR